MGFVSSRHSRALIERLRRNRAGLLYAGGRLPDVGVLWVETVDYTPGGHRPPDALRWQVVTSQGWTNIGSRWPVALVLNAAHLYFHRSPERDLCLVELTP